MFGFLNPSKTTKDYYKILNINRNATTSEIKSAYRRQCLSCHPDKQTSNNNKNETEISDVYEAYEILSDPLKKKIYDNSSLYNIGAIPFDFKVVLNWSIYIVKTMSNLKKTQKYENCKKETQETQETQEVVINNCKSNDIHVNVSVTLDDLYNKKIKKLVINRLRKGVSEKKVLFISLLNYENQYVFKDQGDEDDNGNHGDVIVTVNMLDHDIFVLDSTIDKYDLWMESELSLYEYYYGKQLKYIALDGIEEVINIENFNQRNLVHMVKEMGLPFYDEEKDEECRGDLYISFKLILRDISDNDLNNETLKDILSTIL